METVDKYNELGLEKKCRWIKVSMPGTTDEDFKSSVWLLRHLHASTSEANDTVSSFQYH